MPRLPAPRPTPTPREPALDADAPRIERLLSLTSRTFALSIPLLPGALRTQVGVGYLVFRIADTLEDEGAAEAAQRVDALEALDVLLQRGDARGVGRLLRAWNQAHCPDDPGYAELLDDGRWVIEQVDGLGPAAADVVRHHVSRTIHGMVERLRCPTEIRDVAGLRDYCYRVAGIVGEMLTDLFVGYHPPLVPHRAALMGWSRGFGEGLQLVNILRDQGVDVAAGRRYVPDAATQPRLLALAAQGCADAHRYIDLLASMGCPKGVVRFNTLNLRLAQATLELIRVSGPGAKVPRGVVADLLASLE